MSTTGKETRTQETPAAILARRRELEAYVARVVAISVESREPKRAIVYVPPAGDYELLECGHWIEAPPDSAMRRVCRACAELAAWKRLAEEGKR